jgi:hypothetical protein
MINRIDIRLFTRNRANDIRLRLVEDHGHIYVDIRQWKVIGDTTLPTKNGVKLDTTCFASFKKAVDAIANYLETNHPPETVAD